MSDLKLRAPIECLGIMGEKVHIVVDGHVVGNSSVTQTCLELTKDEIVRLRAHLKESIRLLEGGAGWRDEAEVMAAGAE